MQYLVLIYSEEGSAPPDPERVGGVMVEYDAYSNNSGSEYTSTESDETYSPNYASESYGSQYSPEPEQTEYQQQAPYAYEQHEQQPTEPEQPTSPRTQPRRGRWI